MTHLGQPSPRRPGPHGWQEWLLAFILVVGLATSSIALLIGFVMLIGWAA